MSTSGFVFKRVEKKYLLTSTQYNLLRNRTRGCLVPDKYEQSTVYSLYLDTDDYRLIRSSIDADGYKEKLRIRCYGTPDDYSTVFFELKKKYNGIVYKRRVDMTLKQLKYYLRTGIIPFDTQIMREIDYAMRLYNHPVPAVFIAYDRIALCAADNPQLRVTFDRNIRFRLDDLTPEHGSYGTGILPDDIVLMEIKTGGAMPVWLAHALSDYSIYPASFSKYGTIYRQLLKKEKNIS